MDSPEYKCNGVYPAGIASRRFWIESVLWEFFTIDSGKKVLYVKNVTIPLLTVEMTGSEMNTSPKLLIIDDTEEVLSALSKFFKQKGYHVFSATNGLDGLKMIESQKGDIDLVITDLVLPNISGVAVISIVKKKYPFLPVIAITGWGEHPEALAKEAMADRVMEKPFKLPEIEKAARELLSK